MSRPNPDLSGLVDELLRQTGKKAAADDGANRKCKAFDGPLSLDDFYAYMPMHQYIFATSRELWPASSVNARLPSVEIGTDPKTGKPIDDQRKRVARSEPPGRADDMGAGRADADHEPADLGRRMDRAHRLHGLQPLPWRRRSSPAIRTGPAVARSHRPHLSRRRRAHHPLARASRAAARRQDQPRAGARRRAGHRQGHAAGAGEAMRSVRGISAKSRRSTCSAGSTAS